MAFTVRITPLRVSGQNKKFVLNDTTVQFSAYLKNNTTTYYPFDNSIAAGDVLHVAQDSAGYYYIEEWGGRTKSFSTEETCAFTDSNPPFFIEGFSSYTQGTKHIPFINASGSLRMPRLTSNLTSALSPFSHNVLKSITFEFPTVATVGANINVIDVEVQSVDLMPVFNSMTNSFSWSAENELSMNWQARSGFYWSYNGTSNLYATAYEVYGYRGGRDWGVTPTTSYYPLKPTTLQRAMAGHAFYI